MTDFADRALATMVGALFAFTLAWFRQKRDERREQIESFKTALFILIQQRTFLRNLEAQSLRPQRNNSIRAYSIQPILAAPPTSALEWKPLAFLLVDGDAELVNHLALADAKYRSVAALLEPRNKVHYAFQEKLGASVAPGSMGTLDDIRAIAGMTVSRQLEQMTDSFIENTDDAIIFNQKALEDAFRAFKRRFPRIRHFGVEDLPLIENRPMAG